MRLVFDRFLSAKHPVLKAEAFGAGEPWKKADLIAPTPQNGSRSDWNGKAPAKTVFWFRLEAIWGVDFRSPSFRKGEEKWRFRPANLAHVRVLHGLQIRAPNRRLIHGEKGLPCRPMKFYLASLVWLLVSLVIGWGLWKFSHGGSVWFVALPAMALVVLVARTGCRTD